MRFSSANQPDTLQNMTKSWLVSVDNPIDTSDHTAKINGAITKD